MPPGVTGLVVAAILAAAMSTVSGSINSLSAATTHDIWMPLRKTPVDEATGFRMGRIFTVFWAFVLIGGALLYRAQGTPVVVVALSIASFTYGGLLGGFFLAVLWKRAQQIHALIGHGDRHRGNDVRGVCPAVLGLVRRRWHRRLEPFTRIAWPWYVLIGTSITMIVGITCIRFSFHVLQQPVEQMNGLFAGVDGGGSNTRVLITDEHGAELATAEGPGSAIRPGESSRSARSFATPCSAPARASRIVRSARFVLA